MRDNYKDLATGKFDNSPGVTVSMPRNMVDEDKTRTCSTGLHVAAKSYLPHYGGGVGRVIQVKVDPADVVAIPVDYNNAKMRVCRYKVMIDVTYGFSHY
ncbi:rIIB protein [Klebsiella phage CPRSB]|nr:rIIB protein [Klebsiella phage CPRSB]